LISFIQRQSKDTSGLEFEAIDYFRPHVAYLGFADNRPIRGLTSQQLPQDIFNVGCYPHPTIVAVGLFGKLVILWSLQLGLLDGLSNLPLFLFLHVFVLIQLVDEILLDRLLDRRLSFVPKRIHIAN